MKIIEFTGDPMLQLEKFEDLNNYIFYLNQSSMDEISSYSEELETDIPSFLSELTPSFVLFAEGGKDEEGNEFPDTYIGIQNLQNQEYPYKIAGIYASDLQYKSPLKGQEIYLKRKVLAQKK